MTQTANPSKQPLRTITRDDQAGLICSVVHQPVLKELHLTGLQQENQPVSELLSQFKEVLDAHRASLVKLDLFGSNQAYRSIQATLRKLFGGIHWPLLWVEGADFSGRDLAGFHALAITDTEIDPIRLGDQVVGSVYGDGTLRHCWLGGMTSDDGRLDRATQVEQTYAKLDAALAQCGMELTDIMRTWFFLDKILDWYGEFNRVRTRIFKKRGVFDLLVPASTGIGASNPQETALAVGALALQPLQPGVRVMPVPSPLQCPAPSYGSSFSRAVEITASDFRKLMISGTASITPHGETACRDDIEGQIDLTMQVVDAILQSRGMTFQDATRVTAYLPRPDYLPFMQAWVQNQGLEAWPLVNTQADVCRRDLLFELELDAIIAAPNGTEVP